MTPSSTPALSIRCVHTRRRAPFRAGRRIGPISRVLTIRPNLRTLVEVLGKESRFTSRHDTSARRPRRPKRSQSGNGRRSATTMGNAMDAGVSRYHEAYGRAQRDPEGFWGEAAQAIDWYQQPTRVFDPSSGLYGRWFVGGTCNTCWNAVDRHVLTGRAEQPAIIYDSPVTGTKQRISYVDLQTKTQVLAWILRNLGVQKGDRVLLYMPMIPEAVVGMLACARLGAVHSVVFGGFAAKELASRI